jgi:hypothetical protein
MKKGRKKEKLGENNGLYHKKMRESKWDKNRDKKIVIVKLKILSKKMGRAKKTRKT